MRKKQCFWRFAGNFGGFGNVAKKCRNGHFYHFCRKNAEKAIFVNFAERTSRMEYEKLIGASTPK